MQKVLIIVGPTASGKSALGVKLARKFNGEIISADSRQVYTGLTIGTGKIAKKEMRGVRHHLLDVASPKKNFGAGEFVKHGRRAIEEIASRGKLPIIVGGTGFYIDALVGRLTLPDAPPDPAFRKRIHKTTTVALFTLLKKLDPERAATMSSPSERNNRVRLIRAIEIARALGKNPKPSKSSPYDCLWVGIAPSDADLKKRIYTRLSTRLKAGMVAEARRLHAGGLSYTRMRELGLEYRSLARFLEKEIDRTTLEKELQSDIWRYARKQLGYWKRNKDIHWQKPTDKRIGRHVRAWLKK